MARSYPTTSAEFRRIPGVGEQKLRDFAEPFLNAIVAFLESNERKTFGVAVAAPPQKRSSSLNDSESETLRRFRAGESIEEIARDRGFVRGTICTHLAAAIESGAPLTWEQFFTPAQREEIEEAFRAVGARNFTGAREMLGGKYDGSELRIFRALAART